MPEKKSPLRFEVTTSRSQTNGKMLKIFKSAKGCVKMYSIIPRRKNQNIAKNVKYVSFQLFLNIEIFYVLNYLKVILPFSLE